MSTACSAPWEWPPRTFLHTRLQPAFQPSQSRSKPSLPHHKPPPTPNNLRVITSTNRVVGSSGHRHPTTRKSGARWGPRVIGSSELFWPENHTHSDNFMVEKNSPRLRVLSGMRPTGKLHLGHWVGALSNWVKLQDQYDCFYFIADWHALTTDYADTSGIKKSIVDIAIDWLAAGLDPDRSTLFVQSHVPQHAELHLLFSMITPLGWLERVPTYKEQRENIKDKDL